MSQLVKTKRQANLKILNDLELLRGSSNQKTLYSTRSCVKWPTRAKKGPIYTQTRQINYYFICFCSTKFSRFCGTLVKTELILKNPNANSALKPGMCLESEQLFLITGFDTSMAK
jgi:hypothetical protein